MFSVSDGRGNTSSPSRGWEERSSGVEHLRPSEETSTPTTEEEPAQTLAGSEASPTLRPEQNLHAVTTVRKSQRGKVL